jgi:hypothetical protein
MLTVTRIASGLRLAAVGCLARSPEPSVERWSLRGIGSLATGSASFSDCFGVKVEELLTVTRKVSILVLAAFRSAVKVYALTETDLLYDKHTLTTRFMVTCTISGTNHVHQP